MRDKNFYKKLWVSMADQAAEILASGKALEVDTSRSGLKLYSFRRRHEVVQKSLGAPTGK